MGLADISWSVLVLLSFIHYGRADDIISTCSSDTDCHNKSTILDHICINSHCRPIKRLGEECESDSECQIDDHQGCVKGLCTCIDGFHRFNGTCHVDCYVDGDCRKGDKCIEGFCVSRQLRWEIEKKKTIIIATAVMIFTVVSSVTIYYMVKKGKRRKAIQEQKKRILRQQSVIRPNLSAGSLSATLQKTLPPPVPVRNDDDSQPKMTETVITTNYYQQNLGDHFNKFGQDDGKKELNTCRVD